MKIRILKVLVLLVSISAASVLVWNAARDQKPKGTQKKPAAKIESREVSDVVENPFQPKVTDAEAKAKREILMNSSKSAIMVSDDEVRKMLEQPVGIVKPHLMHSSKSIIMPVFGKSDMEKIIEGEKQAPNTEGETAPIDEEEK